MGSSDRAPARWVLLAYNHSLVYWRTLLRLEYHSTRCSMLMAVAAAGAATAEELHQLDGSTQADGLVQDQVCAQSMHLPSNPAVCSSQTWAQFEKIERVADEILDTEGEVPKDAAVTLLRAAFKLCPACPHPRWGAHGLLSAQSSAAPLAKLTRSCAGKNTKQVFYLDGLSDRMMLTRDVFPALFNLKVTDVLWIGVQPYTLRYEYMVRALSWLVMR